MASNILKRPPRLKMINNDPNYFEALMIWYFILERAKRAQVLKGIDIWWCLPHEKLGNEFRPLSLQKNFYPMVTAKFIA